MSVVRWLMVVGRTTLVGRPATVAFVGWSIWLVETPGVGRPVTVGRPGADASWQFFLLFRVLGVLTVLSMVFLFVPGHASHIYLR